MLRSGFRPAAALALGLLGRGSLLPGAGSDQSNPPSCRRCHQQIVDTYLRTAHFRTSAEANTTSIKGSFLKNRNLLRTRTPGVAFRMERRDGRFSETGVDSAHHISETERISLVVGSGRRGQTYLYWKSGMLFELPVSYLVGAAGWVNSPGYTDGQIDFGRVIPPRCLECHSTSFTLVEEPASTHYSSDYRLGIQCSKCHSDARRHVAYESSHPIRAAPGAPFILNSAHFSRERRLDNCALCHSGTRKLLKPSFSYVPGEPLDLYLGRPSAQDSIPDVHGNQVGLLRRSKCFRSSAAMTCLTCHDVHQVQRDLTQMADRCLGCHRVSGHPMAAEIGDHLRRDCIDCHMPNFKTRALQFNTAGAEVPIYYRSHAIGIYPSVAAAILHPREGKPQ